MDKPLNLEELSSFGKEMNETLSRIEKDKDTIVCPYCGYDYGQAESINQLSPICIHDNLVIDCRDCGRAFAVTPNVHISYVSEKMKTTFTNGMDGRNGKR